MYITPEVYATLVIKGRAWIGKTRDLVSVNGITLKRSVMDMLENYNLGVHIAFGNVFVVARKGCRAFEYCNLTRRR